MIEVDKLDEIFKPVYAASYDDDAVTEAKQALQLYVRQQRADAIKSYKKILAKEQELKEAK